MLARTNVARVAVARTNGAVAVAPRARIVMRAAVVRKSGLGWGERDDFEGEGGPPNPLTLTLQVLP
jgi:hypothetical protein